MKIFRKNFLYLYATAMAGLLLVLQIVEQQHAIYSTGDSQFVAIIALLFTSLGLWIGWKLFFSREVRPEVVADHDASVLASAWGISTREVEVLRLIAAGHSNQEIADKLFLSLNTIKKHTSALFRKLEAERRTQAIERARQIGILQ